MRFKTHENIHPEFAEYLHKNGHNALTVWDQGLRGGPDTDLAEEYPELYAWFVELFAIE